MAIDLQVAIVTIGVVILPFGSLGTLFVFNSIETVILVTVAGLVMANLLLDSWTAKTIADTSSST
jgi:uncharacterized MnhB-related membrane protein